jgi:hypothetical protein
MNNNTIKKCKNYSLSVELPPQYKKAYQADRFCTKTLFYVENRDYCEKYKKPVYGCGDLENKEKIDE